MVVIGWNEEEFDFSFIFLIFSMYKSYYYSKKEKVKKVIFL